MPAPGPLGTILMSDGTEWLARDPFVRRRWYPTLQGVSGVTGQTYSMRTGIYQRIGPLVIISGRITLTARGTMSGQSYIGNLPFVAAGGEYISSIPVSYWQAMNGAVTFLALLPVPGSRLLQIDFSNGTGAQTAGLDAAAISNTFDIMFSGAYLTDEAYYTPGATILIAPTALPNGTVGTAYSQTITASGGSAPYTFSVVGGTLPAGLSLSSGGVLSGTPSSATTSTFTIRGLDQAGYGGVQDYSVTMAPNTYTIDVLFVGGGGGGGNGARWGGGGGGGGGAFSEGIPWTSVTPGVSYSIVVGQGGAAGTYYPQAYPIQGGDGGSTQFWQGGSLWGQVGGGGGGGSTRDDFTAATPGRAGSGGGGGGGSGNQGYPPSGGGSGGQGAGGAGYPSNDSNTAGGGGGGGGAGGDGRYDGGVGNLVGGNGGPGYYSSIAGQYYCGGGGGHAASGQGGFGGGSGSGANMRQNAPANRGGGGGGIGGGWENPPVGGNGGSGILVIRYAGGKRGSGGSESSGGGYYYHVFYSNGTFVA